MLLSLGEVLMMKETKLPAELTKLKSLSGNKTSEQNIIMIYT